MAPVAPTLTFSAGPAYLKAGSLTVTADYDQQIAGDCTPTLEFGGAAAGHFSVFVVVRQNEARRFVYSIDVAASPTQQDGTPYLATVSGGRDLAGNSQSPATTTGLLDTVPPVGHVLTFDGAPSRVYWPSSGCVGSGSLAITAVFSEPIPSGCTPTLSFSGPGGERFSPAGEASRKSDLGFVYCLMVVGQTSGSGDSYVVSVTGARDFAGNQQVPLSVSGCVDTAPPTGPEVTCSRHLSQLGSGPLIITATYSERLAEWSWPKDCQDCLGGSKLPHLGFTGPGAARFSDLQYEQTTAGQVVYTLQVSGVTVLPEGDPVTATISPATDCTGNVQAQATVLTGIVDTLPVAAPTLTFSASPAYLKAGALSVTADYVEVIGTAYTPTLAFSTARCQFEVGEAIREYQSTRFVYPVTVSGETAQSGDGYSATLSGGRDPSGNVQATAAQTGVVDTASPHAVDVAFSRSPAHLSSGPLSLTVTFDEPLRSTPWRSRARATIRWTASWVIRPSRGS